MSPSHAGHTGRTLAFLLATMWMGSGVAVGQKTVPAQAPQPLDPGSTIKVTTRLVVLDVVVTDRQHQLHDNLTRNDFTITENGQPQTILSFEPPSAHLAQPGPPITSTADLERRAPESPVDIMVIDEMNTRFNDTAYARYALEKYLDAQPERLVAPTMLIALSFDHFTLLQDYTQDRQAIKMAIKKHMTTYPFAMARGESVVTFLARTLGAIEQVAKATAGHPGHKNVIWVGKGFRGVNLNSPSLDSNAAHGLQTGVQQIVNLLRDSRITLYAIDPTELSSSVAFSSDDNNPLGTIGDAANQSPFDGDISFGKLATATGGRSFYSRNDVDSEIGESIRDGVNYYTISYRPTGDSEADQPYRKIRITFQNPDLRAGFRDGYYTRDDAKPADSAGRERYDLAAAEENVLVYTGFSVSVAAVPNSPDTYVVSVPESQLDWTPSGDAEAATLRLVAVSLDKQGKMLRRVTKDLTEHRPLNSTASDARSGNVQLQITIPDSPDAERLRFVLSSSSVKKLGTADLPAHGSPR